MKIFFQAFFREVSIMSVPWTSLKPLRMIPYKLQHWKCLFLL